MPTPTIDYTAEAAALRDELIARRRDFHQHPELAFEEYRTAAIVADELSRLGLEVQTGVGRTGVVAVLDGAHDGPTVLVRADMDALPITEENQVEYASTCPGKMHACGHDGHTAISLGVAKVLSKYRDQLSGRVKFVFQPAEEVAAGAKAMIADGVLDAPRPEVSLGLHLWNTLPVGVVGVAAGPTMAGSSMLKITLNGRGGHGAQPQAAIDPVVCAAHLITALQTIVARNVDPADTAVISVTTVQAGHTHNVIAPTATLTGTMRAFKVEVRDLISRRVTEVAQGVAAALGCTAEVEISHSTIPLVNDPAVTARARALFATLPGVQTLDSEARTMGGEDMAFLMEDIPGFYFFLGSADSARGLDYGHHHPRFDFSEEALPLGVALLAAAVGDYVLREAAG